MSLRKIRLNLIGSVIMNFKLLDLSFRKAKVVHIMIPLLTTRWSFEENIKSFLKVEKFKI